MNTAVAYVGKILGPYGLVECGIWFCLAFCARSIAKPARLLGFMSLKGRSATDHKLPAKIDDIANQLRFPKHVALAGHRITRLGKALSSSACLTIAIACHLMLRVRGVETAIVLGTRKTGANLEAHAWLLSNSGKTITGCTNGSGYHPVIVFTRSKRRS